MSEGQGMRERDEGICPPDMVIGDYANSAAAQAGLTLSTAGLLPRDNYSVELLFRFNEANNARRSILQTANRTGDAGQ